MGGLLVAIFVGWVAPRKIMRNELRNTNRTLFRSWHFLCRYLVPIAVGLILLLGVDAKFDFGLNAMIAGLAGG
jgi:NSS family neurotransmitter:Na+ symporter